MDPFLQRRKLRLAEAHGLSHDPPDTKLQNQDSNPVGLARLCGPSFPLSAGNRTCNKQQLKENISYVEKWPCHPTCPARGTALHLESLPRRHRYTESDFKFHQLGLSPSWLSWGPSTPHDIAMAQVPILLSWAQPPH